MVVFLIHMSMIFMKLIELVLSKYLNTLKVPDNWLQDFIEILETYNFTSG